MDDSRFGGMYFRYVRGWFVSLQEKLRRGLLRSGMVTALVLALIVIGLGLAYRERGRGDLAKLKDKIVPDDTLPVAAIARPGGREPIKLMRSPTIGGAVPEFVSVTALPGRGMNVLQISAYLPDKGEVTLLASPTVEGAERELKGWGPDAYGKASMAMGGAFEEPWAGLLSGTPTSNGKLTTTWRGKTITLPHQENGVALNGLMLMDVPVSQTASVMPDGGQARAVFKSGDYGSAWPSNTETTVSVLLSSRSIELTLVAHNVGDVAEPIGIGWHPRFAILAGSRAQVMLHVPARKRVEVLDRTTGIPTGNLLPVEGTAFDFTRRGGVRLGTAKLDETFVDLHQEMLDNGPVAELFDPDNGYGLRLTMMSSTIKAVRVDAPAEGDYVSLSPQFNYPDPFGRQWSKDVDTGMVVLQPGQSTQWKIRLELVLPTPHAVPPL